MSFRKWVAAYGGPKKLAAQLGVTYVAVYSWLKGETVPGSGLALHMIQLSKGAITLEDIVRATRKPKAKSKVRL